MNNMRTAITTLTLVALTLLASCTAKSEKPTTTADTTVTARVDTTRLMVMQIQQCSRLYTTEYKVRKIITQDDEQAVSGKLLGRPFSVTLPTGKRSVAIPIDATIKGYIDFADFSASNITRSGDRIEIVLPDPQVVMTSTRIDHDNAKERVPLLRTHYTDAELSAIERRGRQSIISSIPQMGIIESARANAAALLIPMIEQMGFQRDHITITFRQDFGPADLIKRLTRQTSEHGKARQ